MVNSTATGIGIMSDSNVDTEKARSNQLQEGVSSAQGAVPRISSDERYEVYRNQLITGIPFAAGIGDIGVAAMDPQNFGSKFQHNVGQFFDGASSLAEDAVKCTAALPEVTLNALSSAWKWVVGGGLVETAKGLITAAKEMGKALDGAFKNGIEWIANGGFQKALGAMGEYIKSGQWIKDLANPETWKAIGAMLWGMTGIPSLIECVKCIQKGDWKGAVLHGLNAAICIAGVVTTVMSFGTSAAMTAAVKECRGVLLREGAEELAEQTVKVIGKEAIQAMGRESAEVACNELGKQIIEKGVRSLTGEAVEGVVRATTEKAAGAMLKKYGIQELIEKQTFTLLQSLEKESVKSIAQRLAAAGVENPQAKAALFKKALLNGSRDKLLKKTFEDTFTAAITKRIKEEGGEAAFQSAWKKGVAELATKHGLGDETVSMMLKSGSKGFDEGLEAAVRSCVRKGVEEGFKKFRDRRDRDNRQSYSQRRKEEKKTAQGRRGVDPKIIAQINNIRPEAEKPSMESAKRMIERSIADPDAPQRVRTMAADESGQKSFLVSKTSILGIKDKNDYTGGLAASNAASQARMNAVGDGLTPPAKVGSATRSEIVSELSVATKARNSTDASGASNNSTTVEIKPVQPTGTSNN
ncbi:MAG: hypothetical protein GYA55_14440 [SAR324 cluster bacterium]|uniref:Uncharacterized protein n=1 Tax=SAR324 cluster bacterium TaxID=2024889 RepID=A0A7X9FV47_9DELT|nr:hypothetical protein [SAR324 cluster bacterium]